MSVHQPTKPPRTQEDTVIRYLRITAAGGKSCWRWVQWARASTWSYYTGLFAVMEGASSDLRTGLPRQMIEIHEPLRLQIVVEASTEVLTAIYQRQPSLRELIGGDWVHVIAKDPDSGEFSIFDPVRGFVPWAGPARPLPERARSGDWYRGHTDPLSPALIGERGI